MQSSKILPNNSINHRYKRIQTGSDWKKEKTVDAENDENKKDNLKLNVDDTFMQKRVTGGSMSNLNKTDIDNDKDRERRGDELKLNVDDTFMQRRMTGGSMSGPIRDEEEGDNSVERDIKKKIVPEVKHDLTKSGSKVRFSTEDVPKVNIKKDGGEKKQNTKNESDTNKTKKTESSSKVINRVSAAVKSKKTIERNVLQPSQLEPSRKIHVKSLDLKTDFTDLELDPSSGIPVTPPRLFVPAVSAIGPPSFSPNKLSLLDQQLTALNLR